MTEQGWSAAQRVHCLNCATIITIRPCIISAVIHGILSTECRGGSLTCSSSDGLAAGSMRIAGSGAGRGCTPAVCRRTQEGKEGHRCRCPHPTQPSIAASQYSGFSMTLWTAYVQSTIHVQSTPNLADINFTPLTHLLQSPAVAAGRVRPPPWVPVEPPSSEAVSNSIISAPLDLLLHSCQTRATLRR
jgi:hypothetical protein